MIQRFGAVQLIVVEPGTEIGRDAHDNPMIVTDESAVFNGFRAWVTQKVYDMIKGANK